MIVGPQHARDGQRDRAGPAVDVDGGDRTILGQGNGDGAHAEVHPHRAADVTRGDRSEPHVEIDVVEAASGDRAGRRAHAQVGPARHDDLQPDDGTLAAARSAERDQSQRLPLALHSQPVRRDRRRAPPDAQAHRDLLDLAGDDADRAEHVNL